MTERGKRFNEGKRRWSLIDHRVLEPLVDVMEAGSKKYGERNYEKGMPIVEIMDSLQRHLVEFRDHGNDLDEESKMHHGAHILSNAYILMYNILFHPDMDNRVKAEKKDLLGNYNIPNELRDLYDDETIIEILACHKLSLLDWKEMSENMPVSEHLRYLTSGISYNVINRRKEVKKSYFRPDNEAFVKWLTEEELTFDIWEKHTKGQTEDEKHMTMMSSCPMFWRLQRNSEKKEPDAKIPNWSHEVVEDIKSNIKAFGAQRVRDSMPDLIWNDFIKERGRAFVYELFGQCEPSGGILKGISPEDFLRKEGLNARVRRR